MIEKEFIVKKIQEKIKDNKEFLKFFQTLIEKEEGKKKPNEKLMMNTLHMIVCTDVEIKVYKELIKEIKTGKFDNNKRKLN